MVAAAGCPPVKKTLALIFTGPVQRKTRGCGVVHRKSRERGRQGQLLVWRLEVSLLARAVRGFAITTDRLRTLRCCTRLQNGPQCIATGWAGLGTGSLRRAGHCVCTERVVVVVGPTALHDFVRPAGHVSRHFCLGCPWVRESARARGRRVVLWGRVGGERQAAGCVPHIAIAIGQQGYRDE